MRRWGLSSSVLQAVLGRSALAVSLCNLDLCSLVEEVPLSVLNADDRALDWIVTSAENGNTPREVLMWIFPSFGGHLFDLIKGGGGRGAHCRLYAPVLFLILPVLLGSFSVGVVLASVLECMPCVFVCLVF